MIEWLRSWFPKWRRIHPVNNRRYSTGSLAFATDVRIAQRGGEHYAQHPSARYEAWDPYVRARGAAVIIARQSTQQGDILASGPGVSFKLVPDYNSLITLMQALPEIWERLNPAPYGLVIGRLPEPLSVLLLTRAAIQRKKYVAIMAADVDALLKQIPRVGTALAFLAKVYVRSLLRRSSGIIYVTQRTLQEKYPAPLNIPHMARSNVIMPAVTSLADLRPLQAGGTLRVVSVGTMQSLSKGHDILIHAISKLADEVPILLTLVGSGKFQPDLERLAATLGVQEKVVFAGQINDPDRMVRVIDESDLFALASRSEGLPRAMIEAMARGLPVLGSAAGGIPEILAEEDLVKPSTPEEWASRITEFAASGALARRRLAGRSLEMARLISTQTSPDRLIDFLDSIQGHSQKDGLR